MRHRVFLLCYLKNSLDEFASNYLWHQQKLNLIQLNVLQCTKKHNRVCIK